MAPRKKRALKKKENGGRRPGSGRKPVETHFEALNKRLTTIEDALTVILAKMTNEESKIQELHPEASTPGPENLSLQFGTAEPKSELNGVDA